LSEFASSNELRRTPERATPWALAVFIDSTPQLGGAGH
jgi:hypothetical protein